ncbi:MAG: flagellar hook-basal body complex protein FliE [Rhodocyclaceae bacterium]|jgi:flagellar hook-basal body complex protein FliE|nr:flagellar hook-basal body complex protein FliE [Rhodocyclaceae bacterium]MCO5097993.1 flagellar hook-basal body complex protein FliE [Rhodocyclaceae bacterium]MCZ7653495.1 flagellar hook-basal body complex protein FliE [Rhodocyclaceae bacterium]
MDTRGIEQVLSELRATAQLASGKALQPKQAAEAGAADFGQILKGTLDQVNQAQLDAQKLAQDFSAGTGNASLQDVMMSLQKANLSFQQMVQVRNKLVSAYHDIMNMQV